MKILLTGGAGFIGSHTAVELLSNGFEVVVVDNYSNADVSVNDKICQAAKWQINNSGEKTKFDNDNLSITFYYGDCRDGVFMDSIFREQEIDAVIHFAGLKAVGESVEKPLEYYDNNIGSTLVLLNVMKDHNIKKLIFSSSATVYSAGNQMPLDENSKTGNCTNPYGWTK
ncbi:MAG: GDP-mannose 4,6-dehydratase, partial [Acidaminococcaceae bacterium]|nr:GDP-mannose 4,6-dehydratase [Acidaminococcaceae bacterium]